MIIAHHGTNTEDRIPWRAWYHVTCRGNERKLVFKDDSDRRTIVGLNELVDKPVTMEGIARQVAAHFALKISKKHFRHWLWSIVKL